MIPLYETIAIWEYTDHYPNGMLKSYNCFLSKTEREIFDEWVVKQKMIEISTCVVETKNKTLIKTYSILSDKFKQFNIVHQRVTGDLDSTMLRKLQTMIFVYPDDLMDLCKFLSTVSI